MPPTACSRRELVAGRGKYLADIELPGCREIAFVRSPYAHARITDVRVPADAGISGVNLCRDLKPIVLEGPGLRPCPWLPMATDRARFVGEAVAAVWGPTRYEAEDLADEVEVNYEPLPPESRIHPSLPDDLLLEANFESSSVEPFFGSAVHVFERVFTTARQTPSPMEGRGAAATYDGESKRLTVWASSQVPHLVRRDVSRSLGLSEQQVQVLVPQVGGAFGCKVQIAPEEVAVAAIAYRTGQPMRWIEDRRENLLASCHAHDEIVHIRVAVDAFGVVQAIDAQIDVDVGAWAPLPFSVSTEPLTTASSLFGPYRFRAIRCRVRGISSNRCPIGAYRGVGINAGVFATERMMDIVASNLGIDPVELRRRNAIAEFPTTTPAGRVLDSGDYQQLLGRLEEVADYQALLKWRDARRRAGLLAGIGVALFNEHTGTGTRDYRKRGNYSLQATDAARVRVSAEGRIQIFTSAADGGQEHAESYRILAQRETGVAPEMVDVIEGDTDACPEGTGTFASRTAVGGFDSLVAALRAAAETGLAPGSDITRTVDPSQVFSSGAHLAVAEVDPVTLIPRILRYAAVEDCGAVVNRAAVDDQVRGGIVMGLGNVLLEEQVYDAEGQLLTGSLMDYLLPVVTDVPSMELDHLENPSPTTTLGTKGVGEAGTIGAYGAIANAVADALSPLKVELNTLPYSPKKLHQALVENGGDTTIPGGLMSAAAGPDPVGAS